jgi:hypothetical protein
MMNQGKQVRGAASRGDLSADREFAAAVKALSEAAWLLRVASCDLEQERQGSAQLSVDHAEQVGVCLGMAHVLAAQIDAIGTQTRRLRKQAHES